MPPALPHHETPHRPATQTSTFGGIAGTLPTLTPASDGILGMAVTPTATSRETVGMVTGPTSGGHRSVDVLRPALTLRGKRGLPGQTLTHRGKRAS